MTSAARSIDFSPKVTGDESVGVYADIGFAIVLGLLGIVGFRTVFGGWSWLVIGGSGLLCGIGLGYLGQKRKWDTLILALATTAVYFVLSGIAISQVAVAQVVPTPATIRGAASGAIWGWVELLTAVPPVGRLGNLGSVPLICGLVGGALSSSAALRTKGVLRPVLPMVTVLALGILFGTDQPASLVLQGAGFAVVAIAWVSFRRRGTKASAAATAGTSRMVGAALMLGLAGLTAGLAGNHVPGLAAERFVLRDRSDPPFDPQQYPSPLASFAKYKSDDREVGGARERTLFTVKGLPEGVPLRIAVMDSYDGVVWKAAGGSDGSGSQSGIFERVGEVVPPDEGADLPKMPNTARVQLTVEEYNDIWLPDFGSVREIQFGGPRAEALAEALRFNRTTNVGAVPLRFLKGDRIIIDADWAAVPDQNDFPHAYAGKGAGAGQVGEAIRIADSLPELSERILASGPRASSDPPSEAPIVTDQETVAPGFDSALRIAQEFVISLRYGYSDNRPDEQPSVSGHSQRRMARFGDDVLKVGRTFGNDEQYASALALISRSLNMPSRVVMGFCQNGCAKGKVTGKDVSAWVEVNVDGVGWVPLEATPSPDKEIPDAVQPQPKPTPQNAAEPPPPPVTVPPPSDLDTENLKSKKKDKDNDSIFASLPLGTILKVGFPFVVIGGCVTGVITAKRRRRERRRDRGSPLDRVIGGWDELRDRASDLGRPLPARATRREVASYLGTDAARHSAQAADAAIFGPDTPNENAVLDYWTSIDETYTGIAEEESAFRKLRAELNPTSLIRSARLSLNDRLANRKLRGLTDSEAADIDASGPVLEDSVRQ